MDNFYGAPASKRLGQFMWPDDRMQTAGCPAQVSADGQSVTWPALRASGQVSGSLQLGAPPDGRLRAGVAGRPQLRRVDR